MGSSALAVHVTDSKLAELTQLFAAMRGLVFDRHSLSDRQESNLREYLWGNWNLPRFSHVTAVDSRYVETIQIADLALTLFRKGSGSDRLPTIEGQLPDGQHNKLALRRTGIVGFITMKARALRGRLKEKDAFDIVSVLAGYPGGVVGAIGRVTSCR